MNAPENLIERIQGLFNMANHANSNQNEAENAMRLAGELMAKYGIEQAEIDSAQGAEKSKIGARKVSQGRVKYAEDNWIPFIMEEVFSVRTLVTRVWDEPACKMRHAYVFVGLDTNCAVTEAIAPLLFKSMKDCLRSYLKARGKRYSVPTANAFFKGLTDGFIQSSVHARHAAMNDMSQEDKSRYALTVKTQEDEISEWIEQNLNVKKTEMKPLRRDLDCYLSGIRAGENLDLTTKIKPNDQVSGLALSR